MAVGNLLPPHPATQALTSKTFRPPALDGTLTIPEIFDWHLRYTPTHPFLIYAGSGCEVHRIMWSEAMRAVYTCAVMITRRLQRKLSAYRKKPVVAILGAPDAVTYTIAIMAVMRANCVVFPISTRNSPEAVAHLIDVVGVEHVLLGHEEAMSKLMNDVLHILKRQRPSTFSALKSSPIPLFEDLCCGDLSHGDREYLSLNNEGLEEDLIIMHTSGSNSSFPKPILWTHRHFLQVARHPYFGERDLTGKVIAMHSVPMFHGLGIMQIAWAATCGIILSVVKPSTLTLDMDKLFEEAVKTHSDYILAVPTVFEVWSRNESYVNWMATRSGLLYGGGPLNKAVGDSLTSKGASIFNLYGVTEASAISPVLPATTGYDWNYFQLPDHLKIKLLPYDENSKEFVIFPNDYCELSVVNAKVDGVDAFITSDLFSPHPTKSGYYCLYGRADDQIMHATGEKTNPGPLEEILNQDPLIKASIMFGRGKFQTGVLIEPELAADFNPNDHHSLSTFKDSIWPTVIKMNTFAPQHSRLFKQMIIVAHPSKPFLLTPKGSLRRSQTLIEYTSEIDALYVTAEDRTQADIPTPSNWELPSLIAFVRAVVGSIMTNTVGDHVDLFHHGCDSLQASAIRNTLVRALSDSTELEREVPPNLVYDHPSVSKLANFLFDFGLHTDSANESAPSEESKEKYMQGLVNRFSCDFHTPPRELRGDVILLTGTTGALGSYTLACLASNSRVSRIYAVNRFRRWDQAPLLDTHISAFADRNIDSELVLGSGKIRFLEADLTVPGFELPSEAYKEMHESVTCIIHNAWTVDFNLALASFEPNIKGLRNLIDFSLTSRLNPKFIFTSSIGVIQNSPNTTRHEEIPVPAKSSFSTGYSESKWVSEQILLNAAETCNLNTLIVRVGQLCGGPNGAWNAKEWMPALVQSAQHVGCLPTDNRDVSWIPVHFAAQALVDFTSASFDTSNIVHLVHPRSVPWSTIADVLSSTLSVPLVTFPEWFAKLELLAAKKPDGSENIEMLRKVSALRLLPILRQMSSKTNRSPTLGTSTVDLTRALALSPTLANPSFPQLGSTEVISWVKYWSRLNFL